MKKLNIIFEISIIYFIIKLNDARILNQAYLNVLGYDLDSVEMDLSNRSIDSIDINALEGFKNLEVLYLQDNQIRKLEKDSFKNLDKLRELWLENNSLIEIFEENTFFGLNNLEKVCLFNNPVSNLFPSVVSKLCKNNTKCRILTVACIKQVKSTTTTTKQINSTGSITTSKRKMVAGKFRII